MQQQRIKALETEVTQLKRKIAYARETAHGLINAADKTLAGHVPRGTWSLAKGQKAAAVEIDGCLM